MTEIDELRSWQREPLPRPFLFRGAGAAAGRSSGDMTGFLRFFLSVLWHQGRSYLRLRRWTAERVVEPIAAHALYLARYLSPSGAKALCEANDAGDLEQGLRILLDEVRQIGTCPDFVIERVAKAFAAVTLLSRGFLRTESVAPVRWHSGSVDALFALHSRAPLVRNGYAVRSTEVLSAGQKARFRLAAATRLGYPRDINRFRNTPANPVENIDGITFHELADPEGDGVRGRDLDTYLRAYGAQLADLAAKSDASLIHAASNYQNGLAAAYAGRLLGIPVIYEVRGLWEVTRLSNGSFAKCGKDDARFRLAARLETEACKAADIVICLGEELSGELVGRGVPPDKIRVLPNSVDVTAPSPLPLSKLGLDPLRLTLAYAGAVVPYEGLNDLLSATLLLRESGVDAQALVIGDGSHLTDLKARFGKIEGCAFPGRLSREETRAYLRSADVVVVPRRDLPVTRIVPPIKVCEAMALSKPVAVSRLPALLELIDEGVNGVVFEPDDPASLAQAVKPLLSDRAFREKAGKAAMATAERSFSRATLARGLERIYGELGVRPDRQAIKTPP